MRTPGTIYLITRTHGLSRHLLEFTNLLQMSTVKDLEELNSLLRQSDYLTSLSNVAALKLEASEMERIFREKLSQRFYFLVGVAAGKVRSALESFSRRIEVENLKRVIRATHGNEHIERQQLIPVPRKYQTVNFPALLECRTVRDIIDLLKETPFRDLAEKIEIYEKSDNPLILEGHLDRMYYSALEESLEGIPDENKVKQLIGTEIDIMNLTRIVSLTYAKTEPKFLREMIVEHYHRLSKSLVSKLIELPFKELTRLSSEPPYGETLLKVIDLASRNMPSQAENALWQCFFSFAGRETLKNANSLEYVFAYLFMCMKEARNLITVSTGKQLKMEPERIQSLLFA